MYLLLRWPFKTSDFIIVETAYGGLIDQFQKFEIKKFKKCYVVCLKMIHGHLIL